MIFAGVYAITVPAAISAAVTVSAVNQNVVDTVAAHQSITINDSTASGAGWHVTASATTFTSGANTLANVGTFAVTGSLTSMTATTAPTATCVTTCTLPGNTTVYPVAITTAPSSPVASVIWHAPVSTGLGAVTLGGSAAAHPLGWWVNIPITTLVGTYTSTVTLSVVSGP